MDNSRLVFEDGSDLAEFGACHSVEETEAGEREYVTRTANALAVSNAAHARKVRAEQGANALSDELVRLRTEHEAMTEAYYKQAFFEADTDHAQSAEESAKRSRVINTVSGAISYGRESVAPGLMFESLQADATLARESATLAMWSAGKSAVQRHLASAPLQDLEGGVSWGSFGKTWDLLTAARTAQSRAVDAAEGVAAFLRAEQLKKEMQ